MRDIKKQLKFLAVTALTMGTLIACNDNEETTDTPVSNNGDAGSDSDSEGLPEKSGFTSDDATEEESDSTLGESSVEDQLDLKVGETGQIETTLNLIEVTLDRVSIEESIKDVTPERDYFIVADITLKNLADDTMDIAEAIDVLELTGDLEGGGGPDFSGYYDAIEPMEGSLESGQETKGQLLFEENDFNEYFIRINEGLIAAGGAKNQAIWTFSKKEAQQ
ncbi:hypothetical protein [Alkalicoccobacillus gibsonii]|uniref:hypothetical protein n=1 Tax=Alkalicoccobacillus gibsonii TaxID=79881 RepID=UPI00351422B6